MGAIRVARGNGDGEAAPADPQSLPPPDYRPERCVGCGLCALACDRQRAIAMRAAPDYQLPYRSWFSFLFRGAPGMLATTISDWRKHR